MAPKNKTRDRIVEASLELFNAQGERSVTTNHIAAHLGMSPGNLYYHFRNKQAIIAELFAQYEAQVDPTGYGPHVGGTQPALEIILDAARTAWATTGVQVGIIVAASRMKHPLDARALARLATRYAGEFSKEALITWLWVAPLTQISAHLALRAAAPYGATAGVMRRVPVSGSEPHHPEQEPARNGLVSKNRCGGGCRRCGQASSEAV